MIRSASLVALILFSVAPAPAVRAQDKAEVPKPETVFEHYVEATGGKAAYEKLKNRVSTGTLEISGANIKGDMKVTQAGPNKMSNVTDLGPIGKTRQGTDGDTAWEVSSFTGERVLEGDERDATIASALFNSEIHWKDRYVSVEAAGIEDVDGKPAVKLVLTRKVGKPVFEFYDVASHLLVKQVVTTKTPMGEIAVEIYPSDYRKVDGVLIPHTVKQIVVGQEILMKFSDIKHNVDLPADAFAVPKEIQELQKKKAK
jgi:hypothetical protein